VEPGVRCAQRTAEVRGQHSTARESTATIWSGTETPDQGAIDKGPAPTIPVLEFASCGVRLDGQFHQELQEISFLSVK